MRRREFIAATRRRIDRIPICDSGAEARAGAADRCAMNLSAGDPEVQTRINHCSLALVGVYWCSASAEVVAKRLGPPEGGPGDR
jgi:hypothetical protein